MSEKKSHESYGESSEIDITKEVEDIEEIENHDPLIIAQQQEIISRSTPKTALEKALSHELKRKDMQRERLNQEIIKLRNFMSKRKQTYKRKRKEEKAPTRPLSAYNIFVQDRFSQLAKENEAALKSPDVNVQMKRVPPASLVANVGTQWKELSLEERQIYEEKAREDRRRYDAQMATYNPPEKLRNKKRNKTGYNVFFSAHVNQLKDSEEGVPSERGSVARLVGNAWKDLSRAEKDYYELEAEKINNLDDPDDLEDHDEQALSSIHSYEGSQIQAFTRSEGGARFLFGSHHDRSRYEASSAHQLHYGMPHDATNPHESFDHQEAFSSQEALALRQQDYHAMGAHVSQAYIYSSNYAYAQGKASDEGPGFLSSADLKHNENAGP